MFGAIANTVTSWLSKPSRETADTESSDDEHSETSSENKQEKRFRGKVTNMWSGYGLIDHEVYFAFDVVTGAVPKLGDTVSVCAVRTHDSAGWIAKEVPFL